MFSFNNHLANSAIFTRKHIWHKMFVSIFSTTFIRNFLFPERIQQNIINHILRSSREVPYIFFLILTKREFSPHILIKVPSIQFYKNLFHRAKLFNVGWRNNRHDNAAICCKSVKKPKSWNNWFTSFCHPGTQLRLLIIPQLWLTTRTIQYVHLKNKVLYCIQLLIPCF